MLFISNDIFQNRKSIKMELLHIMFKNQMSTCNETLHGYRFIGLIGKSCNEMTLFSHVTFIYLRYRHPIYIKSLSSRCSSFFLLFFLLGHNSTVKEKNWIESNKNLYFKDCTNVISKKTFPKK